jgi:hypothetical protein
MLSAHRQAHFCRPLYVPRAGAVISQLSHPSRSYLPFRKKDGDSGEHSRMLGSWISLSSADILHSLLSEIESENDRVWFIEFARRLDAIMLQVTSISFTASSVSTSVYCPRFGVSCHSLYLCIVREPVRFNSKKWRMREQPRTCCYRVQPYHYPNRALQLSFWISTKFTG